MGLYFYRGFHFGINGECFSCNIIKDQGSQTIKPQSQCNCPVDLLFVICVTRQDCNLKCTGNRTYGTMVKKKIVLVAAERCAPLNLSSRCLNCLHLLFVSSVFQIYILSTFLGLANSIVCSCQAQHLGKGTGQFCPE